VKFLIDECLSHTYVAAFVARGFHNALHPIHVGLRRARDDQLLAKAIAEDRIMISANAKDFRKLLGNCPIHPGAILVEGIDRETTLRLIFLGVDFVQAQNDPDMYMINRVVEVSRSNGVHPYMLPPD
jgi:predicted nuclease of predicted toxin-antitoxin system